MTIDLSKEEIFEALEDGEEVSTGSWRWGHTRTIVFERDGKHYQFTAQFHSQKGLMTDIARAHEVRRVEKVITTWETVPTSRTPEEG